MRSKRLFQDVVKTFKTKGFKYGVELYWKQIVIVIASICFIIGIVMAAWGGLNRAHIQDAQNLSNLNTQLSEKSYIPKEIMFVKNKAVGEIIKDTHGDIVIKCIGDVSKSETFSSVGNGDVYIHYSFMFSAEDNNFDGVIPYVTASGTKNGKLVVLKSVNKVKINGKWIDVNDVSIDMGKTYDCCAVFDIQDVDDIVFQFINADGNITNLKIAE